MLEDVETLLPHRVRTRNDAVRCAVTQGWRDIEKLTRALALIEDKEEATAERVA